MLSTGLHQAQSGHMMDAVFPPWGALDVAADSAIMYNIVPHTSSTESLQNLRTHSLDCKGGGPSL